MKMLVLHTMMIWDGNWDGISELGMGLHLANKVDATMNELKHQDRNPPKLNTEVVNEHVGVKMSEFVTETLVGNWYIVCASLGDS